MKLKKHIQTIALYPTVDANLKCQGEAYHFPGDMRGQFVKRKKNVSLIRYKNAGFAWVNNSDIATD